MDVDWHTDTLFEVLHHPDGLERHQDVGGVRELMADAAGVLPRGARSQLRLSFDEHDVRDPVLRKMPGDAAAHATTTHNDNVCCRSHVGSLLDLAIWRGGELEIDLPNLAIW